MKKREILLFSLLWLFSGCMSRPSDIDIYQKAIGYIMPLVDSGCITKEYVHIYEHSENDSNSVYSFFEGDDPFANFAEFPSKIIKVRGRYFCFIELDEPELSLEQINRITNRDNDVVLNCLDVNGDIWFMGVSKYANDGAVVKRTPDVDYIIDYAELWPYFSGGHPVERNFYMCLYNHNVVLSDPKYLESDSLKFHIKKVCGYIYVANKTDSTVFLSPNVFDKTFIVANGTDTLLFSLHDSLPVKIAANGLRALHYESKENSSFFQRLPCENAWMALYRLLSDSTYCLLKINNEAKAIRLLHHDNHANLLINDSGKTLKTIWNEGVFDKDKRNSRFFSLE
ncbi:Imm65 family immunity protein [Bacteroides stercorirosoris]|uniref:Immunity protein 65 n=1 Tax=Bacteroides stercorirosoris TaxID=871324 RepID=A0A1M6AJE4_9BACE|nr:Imm65 family immunity protein [Bacteroides stercorirosoris]SHI36547.1 Immunity protein 65 [Bacteroides stercorirosoris]